MTKEEVAKLAFNAGYNRAPQVPIYGTMISERARAFEEWRCSVKLWDTEPVSVEAQKNAYQQGFMAAMLLCNARPSPGVLDEAWETFKLIQGLKEEKASPEKPKDIQRPLLFDGDAFAELTAMMRDPSYAWTWHCNIAVPIMDSIGVSHEQANRAAKSIMALVFGIDVTQFEQWWSLEKHWADARAEYAKKSSDLYADEPKAKGLGFPPDGVPLCSDRTVSDIYAAENAARFKKELLTSDDRIMHTPFTQLVKDALILLLERVK